MCATRQRSSASAKSRMRVRRISIKPYKESFDEVAWSASAIDYYAEIARHENGKVLGSAVDGRRGLGHIQAHETLDDRPWREGA